MVLGTVLHVGVEVPVGQQAKHRKFGRVNCSVFAGEIGHQSTVVNVLLGGFGGRECVAARVVGTSCPTYAAETPESLLRCPGGNWRDVRSCRSRCRSLSFDIAHSPTFQYSRATQRIDCIGDGVLKICIFISNTSQHLFVFVHHLFSVYHDDAPTAYTDDEHYG